MTKYTTALLFLLVPALTFAQKKDKSAVKAATTITAEDMQRHLYIIASKDMEGRDTPSPGQEKAAEYIENHFKSLGLTPGNNGSYRQYFPLYKDSMTAASVELNGTALKIYDDYAPFSNNYAGELRFSELVFAGYGISDGDKRNDYANLNVVGKLVLIADGTPSDYKPTGNGFNSPSSPNGKLNAALKNGASAVLFIQSNFPRKAGSQTANWSMNGFKASQSVFGFNIKSLKTNSYW